MNILLTGASRGIGEQIARVLHRDGATVLGIDVPQAADDLHSVMGEIGGDTLALDVEDGQPGVEPPGQPPGPVAEQREHRRDQGHPDQERVDQHADREAEGEGRPRAGHGHPSPRDGARPYSLPSPRGGPGPPPRRSRSRLP